MGRRKAGGLSLTKIEELVLMAVHQLGDSAYGVSIRQSILANDEDLSMGSVYFALERMEKQGLLKSRLGESLEERGGRARRYFEITGDGMSTLQSTLERQMGRLQTIQTMLNPGGAG